ncbi:2-hydroxy-3-keto-5-methylthiopentenyl-1-phosphate phosphatase [Peribacillus alkalitolerans]|uniref:2-hydroxy-3-keto-5-methylthiopentenyl-1- phosphate phosphatase n=1 Tax=Peribacillus alkalitolerans TaxID=1550385 RepID=UPI0013D0F323|nr:2-hydroxy-3-keto-5-methylthiopentenyl-1-phosphate phosphatase [Peribacillus alkalitolerans]
MRPVIFCDFDGTITNSDNIVAIMKQFSNDSTAPIKDAVLNKDISIREGVGRMFAHLESGLREQIIEFVLEKAVIRTGFADFVDYTKQERIPFYVVSGGIDFFVKPMIDGIVDPELLFCNSADFSRDHIEILWPHSCDRHCSNDCGCCKPSVIRKLAHEGDFKIVIGDSITDVEAAKMADLVLARDYLIDICDKEGIQYRPFENFDDCINIIKKELEVIV